MGNIINIKKYEQENYIGKTSNSFYNCELCFEVLFNSKSRKLQTLCYNSKNYLFFNEDKNYFFLFAKPPPLAYKFIIKEFDVEYLGALFLDRQTLNLDLNSFLDKSFIDVVKKSDRLLNNLDVIELSSVYNKNLRKSVKKWQNGIILCELNKNNLSQYKPEILRFYETLEKNEKARRKETIFKCNFERKILDSSVDFSGIVLYGGIDNQILGVALWTMSNNKKIGISLSNKANKNYSHLSDFLKYNCAKKMYSSGIQYQSVGGLTYRTHSDFKKKFQGDTEDFYSISLFYKNKAEMSFLHKFKLYI